MKQQSTIETNNKPSYFRIVLKKQNNRVEYRILGSDTEHYYKVQMHNGRAICCMQADGEKCPARQYRPGVPCKHMQRANELERLHREQQKIEQVLESEKVAAMPDPVKAVVAQELQRYLSVVAEQTVGVAEPPRTKEEWKAATKRQKAADRAAAKEYAASVAAIKAAQAKAS